MTKKINWKMLILSLLTSWGAGAFSSFLTAGNQEIYQSINRPALAPPGIVFPIVWSILYTLMGISFYLILVSEEQNKKDAILIYVVQLLLNVFWSVIFFNMREYLLAFLWIVALWLAVYTMIQLFKKINETAALLQVPYLLWVSFATYLTLAIYYLN